MGRALALELEIASKVGRKGRLLLSMLAVTARGPNRESRSRAPRALGSRQPQPRPAATCYGHVSRPGSPLRSGALGLARASLLAPSRLLPKKLLLWSEE